MRQNEIQPPAAPKAPTKQSLRVLVRDALIVFAVTGAISVAIGSLPHFN